MSEENVSLPVAQALASALEKIEAYVPTEYVDNSEPDIDAEHLNHAEQGIMRVTNLLNAAVDVIQGQESRLADAETKIGTAALTGGMTDLSSGLNTLNSNMTSFRSKDFLDNLKFSSTVKGYVASNEKVAKVVTMLNNIKIGIINLSVNVSASNGYERKPFVTIPNEMKPSKNIIVNANVNGEPVLAYYQSFSGSFVIVYNKSVQEDAEVSLFGAYLISG